MKKVLVAVSVLVALAGCGKDEKAAPTQTSKDCLTNGPARAALAQESRVPLTLRWDEASARPRMLRGAFRAQALTPELAARGFLARHAGLLRLRADGSDLELRSLKRGLRGTYVRFEQRLSGLPVFGGEVIVHVADAGAGLEVSDANLAHFDGLELVETEPRLARADAITAAERAVALSGPARVPPRAVLGVLPVPTPRLAWRVEIAAAAPVASWEVMVDALSGEIVSKRDRLQRVDGSGLVFDPNPIAASGDLSLVDGDDQTTSQLDALRVRVVLPRLDGSGLLRGDWVDAKGPTRANEPSLVFDYDRSDDRFEEVMAYYHLDRVQERIQALGFTNVNNRRITVNVDGMADDNSYYDPETREITTGTGGIDDAEDADVIVHEYGHSIQDDQVAGFGAGEQGAIGEGFGDYLAAGVALDLSRQVYDPACLAEWDAVAFVDSVAFPPCMRRVDGAKHYPEAMEGEVHSDGEIWSAALWRARELLGGDVMDTLVIESHFLMAGRDTMLEATQAIRQTDQRLYAGEHLALLERAFVAQGVSRELTPPAQLDVVADSKPIQVENPRSGATYRNQLDDTQVVNVPGALGLRLHFSKVETELSRECLGGACDNVYLYDGAGNLFQILNGSHTDVTSVVIPGDTVKVRLVTDPSVELFGYQIDRVDSMGIAACGDGRTEEGEACDGADLGTASCQQLGYRGGALSCRPDCTVDATGCEGLVRCGDGILDPGEQCDGADLGGKACGDSGFAGGSLSCKADCAFETSLCNQCGDGVRQGSEACDGADLGGADCAGLGLGTGAVTCSNACTLDTSACIRTVCP